MAAGKTTLLPWTLRRSLLLIEEERPLWTSRTRLYVYL